MLVDRSISSHDILDGVESVLTSTEKKILFNFAHDDEMLDFKVGTGVGASVGDRVIPFTIHFFV